MLERRCFEQLQTRICSSARPTFLFCTCGQQYIPIPLEGPMVLAGCPGQAARCCTVPINSFTQLQQCCSKEVQACLSDIVLNVGVIFFSLAVSRFALAYSQQHVAGPPFVASKMPPLAWDERFYPASDVLGHWSPCGKDLFWKSGEMQQGPFC